MCGCDVMRCTERCVYSARMPYTAVERSVRVIVTGHEGREAENRSLVMSAHTVARKPNALTEVVGRKICSCRKRIEGQANQRSAVRL